MSISGSVVLYPTGSDSPPAEPERVLRLIVGALEGCGVVQPGTATAVTPDGLRRFAGPSATTPLCHVSVEPAKLLPAVGGLVLALSEADWLGEGGDELAVPLLDVTTSASPITLANHDGSEACRSWAFVEFSWESARLHPDLHRVLDEAHPAFDALAAVLGGPVRWCVVSG